ncbi:MAG: hypothetical protein DRJ36_02075 [Thermoprotei archaeon]|nr:MAG: hypothetical protein DRJ36_02075 [Thermoprotei archaeon]
MRGWTLKLRDRDAVVTSEGIIFRVYGYFHPPRAYVCDVEYAPSTIYRTDDPRAIRTGSGQTYYKFYADGGLRFVVENYPQYTVFYEPLGRRLVGVHEDQIVEIRKPDERLKRILKEPRDELLEALHEVLGIVMDASGLKVSDFGVFGSLLHGFYHPSYSDLDLTVYGGEKIRRLREALKELYMRGRIIQNEFADVDALRGKAWRFERYTTEEYIWHQRRKLIYGVYLGNRKIKVEFEPVKDWSEIKNEYDPKCRITWVGWVKAKARIADDKDAPYIPSIYELENVRIIDGPRVADVKRVISYVEEYRLQAFKGEDVYVEGNLERVETPSEVYHQITLTYGPRYYEQVLKVARP